MTDAFLPFEFAKNFRTKGLTVLSSGLGQESGAILLMLLTNKKFYEQYVGDNHLLVVCSDTGNEHDETYEHALRTKELCDMYGIEFVHIMAGSEYHTSAWPSLQGQYERPHTMGSAAFRSSACTDALKIKTLHRFIDSYVSEHWGFEKKRDKKALIQFAEAYGKIKMIIGFNSEEANRVQPDHLLTGWEAKSIKKVYPLIDRGITRKMSHQIFQAANETIPYPSSCKLCHYQSPVEVYIKYKYDRKSYKELLLVEYRKLKKFTHKREKNLGFWGTRKTITQTLRDAIEKPVKKAPFKKPLKEWTYEELDDYKMSHGHCMSKGY